MNIKKKTKGELIDLMKIAINHYNKFQKYEWLVKPAIPILFFGNVQRYLNSKKKIISVALNPSKQEFLENEKRFSFCPDKLDESDALNILDSLNEYFDFNPYDNWFNKHTERIMNQMNTSYYNKTNYANTALNTDFCTPLATNPTWSKLIKEQDKKLINCLKKEGFKIWIDLMKILKPDIILISLAKGYLESNKFIKMFKLRINADNVYSFGYDDVLKEFREGRKSLKTKDIIFYRHQDIPFCNIYHGRNNTGTPFGMIKYKEKNLEENLKEIKHVAKLIVNHFKS